MNKTNKLLEIYDLEEVFNQHYNEYITESIKNDKNKSLFVLCHDKKQTSVNCKFDLDQFIKLTLEKVKLLKDMLDKEGDFVIGDFVFNNEVSLENSYSYGIKFENCIFNNDVIVENYQYESKFVFSDKCKFKSLVYNNVKFKRLFQIYDSTIYGKGLFFKVNFLDNAVFTKSTFNSNLLFTYSTFDKLGIFSRAQFNNSGLDLSQSIINGNLTFFETNLNDFTSKKIDSNSPDYDKAITEDGDIPTQNKRETFRIIKHQLEQQNNLIEAEKYARLEKLSLLKSYFQVRRFNKKENCFITIKKYAIDLINFTLSIPNILILILNFLSNNFKTNWLFSIGFIALCTIGFDFWLKNISTYYFYSENTLLKLINPTDLSFYNKFENNTYAYSVYFGGKIVIGFGIYQLVQAFRKFK
jgi:hypothetical protein